MIKESKTFCSDKSPRFAQVQCLRWCYIKEDVSLLLWGIPDTCSELPVVLMLPHKWPRARAQPREGVKGGSSTSPTVTVQGLIGEKGVKIVSCMQREVFNAFMGKNS